MPKKKLINWTIILRVLSFLLIVEAAFMLSGLPFAWYYDESLLPLLYSALITAACGLTVLLKIGKNYKKNIGKREGYLIVALTWVVISFFGTLPFLLSASITDVTDAFFETMSGLTTTGASILTDIESLPKSILYWRSMTQWLGGMGIIVLTVAILPFLGIGGMQLMVAEMPGLQPDKLHPRITATAKRFWGIYVIFTLAEVLLLWAGEMDFFEAINHAFATMATGGFSTQNESIAAFGPYSQYVIVGFMILAGTNFTLHYYALHRQFDRVLENQEFRVYLGIIILVTAYVSVFLVFFMDTGVEQAFRDALFTVVSILTTTGFVTVDYIQWHYYIWVLVFALMFIGGSAGSTGGGMKIIRHFLLVKNSWLEMKRAIHPQAIIPVKYNHKSVSKEIIFNVMAFFLIYMMIFAFGVVVLALIGLDFETSIGATIASLGNIGPGIGGVGPVENYAFFSPFTKWFLSFLMLLGRLELFTILIVLSPAFWRR